MANPFDQFDQPASSGNPFDRFDAPAKAPVKQLSVLDKLGQGIMDPVAGASQLIEKAADKIGLSGAMANATNWLSDKTGGVIPRYPSAGVDPLVRSREADYKAKRAAAGENGFDGWRTVGNVVSPVNLVAAATAPAALPTLGARIGAGAVLGGASSALSPVDGADYWSDKGKQIATGAALGGAAPAVMAGVSRVISPNATRNANLQLLKQEGVNPTVGQSLGGRWNALEEKAQSVPILGDMISKARTTANTQFETAAHNRALAPIGQSLPDGVVGRDAVTYTESALKNAYDDVLNRIGAIQPDQTFTSNVANLQGMVNRLVMPKAEKAKFTAALNDVTDSIDPNGVITSDAYKALESSLGTDARKLGASTNIYEGKLAPAVKQLQGELRDMLQRQAGSNADDLKAVNAGWANFKRVQNAASKVGAEDGKFTPAQFANAVRAMDKSKDKGAFARGSALGQDLGDAGKSVLGQKVPNSGTADRLFMGGGALGSYLINPMIPASLLGGAALYTQPAQRLLGAAVSSRPAMAQPTADLLRQLSPAFSPAAAQMGMGLLDQ